MSQPASPEPIRVLHIITRLIVGGAQENTLYTASLLDKTRYRVEILSGPQTGSEGSLIEEARSLDIPLTILPALVRQIQPGLDLRALREMRRILRSGRYEIVHTHSSKAGVIGRLAARLERVPIIVHSVHGWSFHDFMSPLTRQVYIWLERWLATFSSALIVVTRQDELKGRSARIGQPGQYHLVRSAIPLDGFSLADFDRAAVRRELQIPEEVFVVGNVGRFSAQKNPLDWIKVCGMVAQASPEARFLLVGDGPLRQEVEEAAERQGIAGRTIFTGLRRDAARMMSAMDVFLLTSLWEGLPRVIPQAMAMSLPVVATRADGSIEAIQDDINGFLCTPGDIQSLAQRCIELRNEPLCRAEIGCRARESISGEFDLDKMISQIDELYQRLLKEHQTGSR